MKLKHFELSIPEGNELENGYVDLPHGSHYTLRLGNETRDRCDVEVLIDGQAVGTWRVNERAFIEIERPAHDHGRFTYYAMGTREAAKAHLIDNKDLGLVQVRFRPERDPEVQPLFAGRVGPPDKEGGTGLSGHSAQEFTTVTPLQYDKAKAVTIYLRLITNLNEPRPLSPRSTPIPPRLPHASRSAASFTNDQIIEIARQQSALLWILLASIASYFIPYATIIACLATGYFVYRLALATQNSEPVLMGFLSLIPFVHIVVLLIINSKATEVLKNRSLRVGLMGVRPSALRHLAASGQATP